MSWLFFGGADKVEASGLSKEDANKLCDKLSESNGDSTYSGFYVTEETDDNPYHIDYKRQTKLEL